MPHRQKEAILNIPDFFERVPPDDFARMRQSARYTDVVPVERIIGSMNRSGDYGKDWKPLKPDPQWDSIFKAAKEGKDIGEMSREMPIVLYKYRSGYWVGDDGNRRVSVAKVLGVRSLRAQVIDIYG